MAVQRRPKTGTDKRGRVSWVVRWYEDGKQKSKSFDTRSDASAFDATITTAKARGERLHFADSLTVTELFDMWRARPTVTRQATIDGYKDTAKNLGDLGDLVAQKVRPEDVEAWHKALTVTGRTWKDGTTVSERTAREHLNRLSSAFTWGQRRDLVAQNACQKADITGGHSTPKEGAGVTPWNRSDFLRVATQLETGGHLYKTEPKAKHKQKADANPVGAMVVRLAVDTGARLSELLGLTWEDIDTDQATVSIVKQVGRGGKYEPLKTENAARVVPVPRELAQTLEDYKSDLSKRGYKTHDGAPVLPNRRGTPTRPITAGAHVRHASTACGLDGLHLHAARHLYASTLIHKGAPIVTVSKLLGHANPSITMQVYSHALEDYTDTARAYIE